MENTFKHIGKRIVILSAIFTFVLTLIIEIFYDKMVYTMPGYVLRTSQIIAFVLLVVSTVVGATIQFIRDIKEYGFGIMKKRMIFPIYIMIVYILRQMIERKINILEMVIAVGVAIIISFMYRYFFCINKEM